MTTLEKLTEPNQPDPAGELLNLERLTREFVSEKCTCDQKHGWCWHVRYRRQLAALDRARAGGKK